MIKYQKIFVNTLSYISSNYSYMSKKPELSKIIDIKKIQSILK